MATVWHRDRVVRVGLRLSAFLFALVHVVGPIVMAGGANNRLERACPVAATPAGEWTYDRGSWLPLLWSCGATRPNGEVVTIRVWDTGW